MKTDLVALTNSSAQSRRRSILGSISEAISAFLVVVGGLVITGWIFNIPLLKSVSPNWVMMKVNTAACFVLAGASLWCLCDELAPRKVRIAGRACAAIVTLVALLTLGEHLLGAEFGIDQLLMQQPPTVVDTASPGRMSAATAFCFLLIGLALLNLDRKNRHGHRPVLAFALFTALIGLLAIAGYTYQVKSLYAISPFSSMAVHTALLFIAASIGILCARPDKGPFGILTADGIGSTMARRILPFAIILPFLIGWLRLTGERAGLYGFEFGLALFATSNAVVFATLIWLTALSLNRNDAERQRTEEALQKREAQLETIVESLTEGVAVSDLGGQLLHFNRAALDAHGFASLDECRRHLTEFTDTFELAAQDGTVLPVDQWPLARILRGENLRDLEVRIRRINTDWKRVFNYGGTLVQDADGQPMMAVVTISDITGRKRAEQSIQQLNQDLAARIAELDAERARWKSVVEGIADEVWISDMEGRMSLVNLPAVTHMGLEEFKDKSVEQVSEIAEVLDADGRPRPNEEAPLLRALRGATVRGEEILRDRATGRTRWRQFSAAPIRDASGATIGSVAVTRDITEHRQAEEEVRRLNRDLERRVELRTAELSAKNKELETFSYSVSHDLKAPLRGIDGYSRLLLSEYEDKLDKDGQGFLRNIRSAATQMQQLIDDLLSYSKLERRALYASRVDPRTAVEVILNERKHDLERTRLSVRLAPGAVHADPEGLAISLRNLIDNAVKFSGLRKKPVIEIESHVEAKRYIFSVRDNGTGFDMKYHDRIFQIFQRLHRAEEYSGTGIGLAIVRKAMDRMGGRVWAESEPDKGSVFFLDLPCDGFNGSSGIEDKFT
jgi:PAS domain S-box-containing protein